jgi:cell division protein FtsQ
MRRIAFHTRRPVPARKPRAARRNISRRTLAVRQIIWLRRLAAVCWTAVVAAGVILVSLFFIFVHDVFTQSDLFRAHQIQVAGAERLSPQTVIAQAGLRSGINVLSVNLTAARKRLLAHPWIAEAEIQREIPSTLRLRIREHLPLAVVDVGPKFLLNRQGEIFKKWEPADSAGLPVVTGLAPADLRAADRSAAGLALMDFGAAPPAQQLPSRPMDAVLQVLMLGRDSDSALPSRDLRAIRVDRELGLTLVAYAEGRAIRIGYNDYPAKYHLLRELLAFFRTQPTVADFERIDLNDINRVIVNPVKAELPKKTGPQGG